MTLDDERRVADASSERVWVHVARRHDLHLDPADAEVTDVVRVEAQLEEPGSVQEREQHHLRELVLHTRVLPDEVENVVDLVDHLGNLFVLDIVTGNHALWHGDREDIQGPLVICEVRSHDLHVLKNLVVDRLGLVPRNLVDTLPLLAVVHVLGDFPVVLVVLLARLLCLLEAQLQGIDGDVFERCFSHCTSLE